MRALLLIVAILAGLCPLAARSEPVRLWENTYVGMSRAEVLQAVPGAVESSGPDGEEEARLDDVQFGGENFTAIFYFTDGRLTEVMLELDDANRLSEKELESVFRGTVAFLIEQYGEPFDVGSSDKFLIVHKADWRDGDISIVAFSIFMDGDLNMLGITYQTDAR